jgi:hypothetical protein
LMVFPELQLVVLFLHHNVRPGEGRHTMNSDEVREYLIPAIASDELDGFCIFKICF